MKEQSNVITFPGRSNQKEAEKKNQKTAKLVAFVKEYGPTALFAILWIIFIVVAGI